MWTLFKGSFWFGMVLVLLPVFNAGSGARLAGAPPVVMSDAIDAVSGVYSYVSNMCTEKPDVCEKGSKTVTALGYRAKEGARVAYEYLDQKFADDPAKTADASADQKSAKPGLITKPLRGADAELALAGSADAEQAVNGGVAAQPMPGLPKPYRPPVADAVVTGSVPAVVPVPLPRPVS